MICPRDPLIYMVTVHEDRCIYHHRSCPHYFQICSLYANCWIVGIILTQPRFKHPHTNKNPRYRPKKGFIPFGNTCRADEVSLGTAAPKFL